ANSSVQSRPAHSSSGERRTRLFTGICPLLRYCRTTSVLLARRVRPDGRRINHTSGSCVEVWWCFTALPTKRGTDKEFPISTVRSFLLCRQGPLAADYRSLTPPSLSSRQIPHNLWPLSPRPMVGNRRPCFSPSLAVNPK